MNQKFSKYCFFVSAFLLFTLSSCEDITVDSLSGQKINIIAPLDSLTTSNSSNTFVWENVQGAEKYEFQVASPKFDSVVRFVLDSTFTKNSISYSLPSGKYQWRIKAINSGSQTSYFTRTITIL
jgi:hypothetical protein